MTLGPIVLVPMFIIGGTLFLALAAAGTAITAGLISVGYGRWGRAALGRPPEFTGTDSGLDVLDE
ncbi:hypothetical protein [Cryptosporangium aurantiacum]|uniref:Uncharacterized protein n=1 Tax=Cryptosporangium aurantiacum TaxID=134849 RepID=A0A1M7PT42_9ACTN|nr:hypothetical protein [Cryptosporangium aurantiacum]SHN20661.1 hypothetical protein SAMN05443668_103659 [Cryptosporangium aurantiacum]